MIYFLAQNFTLKTKKAQNLMDQNKVILQDMKYPLSRSTKMQKLIKFQLTHYEIPQPIDFKTYLAVIDQRKTKFDVLT